MADNKKYPPPGMVGTPRGYVKKADLERVDENMQPVAEVGKELLWLTPIGKFGRAGKALIGAEKAVVKEAVKDTAKVATKEAAKDTAKVVAKDTAKAARPARGVKPGSLRQKTLDELKQGPKQPVAAKDVKSGSLRQQTLDSLKQGPKKPVRAADVKAGGARATFLKDAKAGKIKAAEKPAVAVGRKPRPGEKKFIGPVAKPKPGDRKFIGPQNRPQPGDKRFIGPANRPKPGEPNFIGPANKPRTFGSMSRMQKIAIGAGAAGGGAMLYKSASKPKAQATSSASSSSSSGTPAKLPSAGDKTQKKGGMSAEQFRAGRQGQAKINVVTGKKLGSGQTKSAGDKSRLAGKKMSNFERMKMRQYEKEGYGGRSMTASSAKSRVEKERGFKFRDLFRKKK